MDDPTESHTFSDEELEHVATSADLSIRRVSTPGLKSLSGLEQLLLFTILLIIGGALYIHLDIRPFLPINIPPSVARWLTIVAMVAFGVAVLWWVVIIVMILFGILSSIWFRVRPNYPKIICRNCLRKRGVDKWLEKHACPDCGYTKVSCATFSARVSFDAFLDGEGCSECGGKNAYVVS
ncbi:MAG: hypothetical protein GY762_20985 [Proteobacteria bacterium]|nr:hypothetical protein [Pseudomonadota bacterium]